MTDPVCGMSVTPEKAAAAWEYEDTTYVEVVVGSERRGVTRQAFAFWASTKDRTGGQRNGFGLEEPRLLHRPSARNLYLTVERLIAR